LFFSFQFFGEGVEFFLYFPPPHVPFTELPGRVDVLSHWALLLVGMSKGQHRFRCRPLVLGGYCFSPRLAVSPYDRPSVHSSTSAYVIPATLSSNRWCAVA